MRHEEIIIAAIEHQIDPEHLAILMHELEPNLYDSKIPIIKMCSNRIWLEYDYNRQEWRSY